MAKFLSQRKYQTTFRFVLHEPIRKRNLAWYDTPRNWRTTQLDQSYWKRTATVRSATEYSWIGLW